MRGRRRGSAVHARRFLPRPLRGAKPAESYITQTMAPASVDRRDSFQPVRARCKRQQFRLRETGWLAAGRVSVTSMSTCKIASGVAAGCGPAHEVQLTAPNIELVVEKRWQSVNWRSCATSRRNQKPAAPQPLPRVHIGSLSVDEGRIGSPTIHADASPFTAAVKPIRFAFNDFETTLASAILTSSSDHELRRTTRRGPAIHGAAAGIDRPLQRQGLTSRRSIPMHADSLPLPTGVRTRRISGYLRFALGPALALERHPAGDADSRTVAGGAHGSDPVPVVLPNVDIRGSGLLLRQGAMTASSTSKCRTQDRCGAPGARRLDQPGARLCQARPHPRPVRRGFNDTHGRHFRWPAAGRQRNRHSLLAAQRRTVPIRSATPRSSRRIAASRR